MTNIVDETGEVIEEVKERSLILKDINDLVTDEVFTIFYQLQFWKEQEELLRFKLLPMMRDYYHSTKKKTLTVKDDMKVTYHNGQLVERFDVKKFMNDHPDLYKEYLVNEYRKEYISIKVE